MGCGCTIRLSDFQFNRFAPVDLPPEGKRAHILGKSSQSLSTLKSWLAVFNCQASDNFGEFFNLLRQALLFREAVELSNDRCVRFVHRAGIDLQAWTVNQELKLGLPDARQAGGFRRRDSAGLTLAVILGRNPPVQLHYSVLAQIYAQPPSSGGIIGILGGIVGLIAALFILLLAVVWLIFPFLVDSKLSALKKEAERQTELLEKIARNTRPASDTSTSTSSAHYITEENKVSAGLVVAIVMVMAAIGGIALYAHNH